MDGCAFRAWKSFGVRRQFKSRKYKGTGQIDLDTFEEPIFPTIKPEHSSSLVSNESSGSLLSEDVPGYKIWTKIVRDMQRKCDSNLDSEISQNDCLLIQGVYKKCLLVFNG